MSIMFAFIVTVAILFVCLAHVIGTIIDQRNTASYRARQRRKAHMLKPNRSLARARRARVMQYSIDYRNLSDTARCQ